MDADTLSYTHSNEISVSN